MFHVLWYEHLLSLVICHHSSILLFHLILFLFISSLSYAYSFHRFSFLYSPSHSTSHFHLFSYQHTLSSLFFYAIPFLSFNPFSPLSHSILPHYSTPFSFILSSFFPFIPFISSSLILFLFHPSSYSISTPLSYTLLPLSFTSHSLIRFSSSILLFVPILLSIPILLLLLLLLTPLSTIILSHIHSHTLHSVHSLLSYLSFFLLEPSSLPFLFIPIFSIFQSLLLPYHYPLPSLSY